MSDSEIDDDREGVLDLDGVDTPKPKFSITLTQFLSLAELKSRAIDLGIDVESLEGDKRRRETWVAAIRALEAVKRGEQEAEESFDYSPKTKIVVLLRNSALSVALQPGIETNTGCRNRQLLHAYLNCD